MITPSPRGFPATSNTLQICEHVEDGKKGKHPPQVDVDLANLFPPLPHVCKPPDRVISPKEPTATVSFGITERKLYIPTGRRRIRKKDGLPGSEEKIPVILVTVTATVTDGKREFFFRVTNRSQKVFDSRDNKRKPLAEVTAELERLCPLPVAEIATATLAAQLAPPRENKPRPKPAPAPDPMPPVAPSLTSSRAAVRTIVNLIRDPVLEYLRRPITPLPDFLS